MPKSLVLIMLFVSLAIKPSAATINVTGTDVTDAKSVIVQMMPTTAGPVPPTTGLINVSTSLTTTVDVELMGNDGTEPRILDLTFSIIDQDNNVWLSETLTDAEGVGASQQTFTVDLSFATGFTVAFSGTAEFMPGQEAPKVTVFIGGKVVADAGEDQVVPVGALVTLDGAGSSANDPNLRFDWTLTTRPPTSGAILMDSTQVNPFFQADQPGVYEASLVVEERLSGSMSLPDTVEVMAIDPTDFAAMRLADAIAAVRAIPRRFFVEPTVKRELIRLLNRAVRALQNGNTRRGLDRAKAALKRTDGCALRGRPDPSAEDLGEEGFANIDHVTRCVDQANVYPPLNAAVDVLR